MSSIKPPEPRNTKHGYQSFPKSRAVRCREEHMGGGIQWEPQSVEAPKGFPKYGPPDGQLASGGISRFSALDGVLDPKGRQWKADRLTAGAMIDWEWWLTAPHPTTRFEYFITRDGWDPTTKLTRAHFDPEPFLTLEWDRSAPAQSVSHWGRVPSNKSGRHVIYAAWTIDDTAMAFYQAIDVDITAAVTGGEVADE